MAGSSARPGSDFEWAYGGIAGKACMIGTGVQGCWRKPDWSTRRGRGRSTRTVRELPGARGIPVPIGVRAFEIIEALVRSGGQLVTKDDLMARVWPGAVVEENTLAVHISAIRKALGADRAMLKTHFGRGYRLLGRWTLQTRTTTRPSAAGLELAKPVRQSGPGQACPRRLRNLIGRDAAVQHLLNLMSAYRVVTLTGAGRNWRSPGWRSKPPGRRCLAMPATYGWSSLPRCRMAAWSRPRSPAMLGLDLGPNDISPEALSRAIGRARRLLLVIDNCEHIVDAAATMVETLTRHCPAVSVVATSRELLRIQGECAYRVLPLDVPGEHQSAQGGDDFAEASAVRLFIAEDDRAAVRASTSGRTRRCRGDLPAPRWHPARHRVCRCPGGSAWHQAGARPPRRSLRVAHQRPPNRTAQTPHAAGNARDLRLRGCCRSPSACCCGASPSSLRKWHFRWRPPAPLSRPLKRRAATPPKVSRTLSRSRWSPPTSSAPRCITGCSRPRGPTRWRS